MIDANAPIKIDNIIRVERPVGDTVSFRTGDIVKAEVMDIIGSGMVMLKITPPAGRSEGLEGKIIRAKTLVPMEKGDSVTLEADDDGLRFRLIERNPHGVEAQPSESHVPQPFDGIPKKLMDILTNMSLFRLKSGDYKILKDMLDSIPSLIKDNFPEFKTLSSLIPNIEELDSGFFKGLVETGGVLFETRLKMLALLGKTFHGDDQKRLLMKIKEILGSIEVGNILKYEGLKKGDIINTIDKFIKNIEFYQLSSSINDMIFSYIPIIWSDMKDGEMSFKKKQDSNTFTCDIKLDLVTLGKIMVNITWYNNEIYINFNIERDLAVSMLKEKKAVLKKRLGDAGLLIKSINVNLTNDIQTFGSTEHSGFDHGLDIRV